MDTAGRLPFYVETVPDMAWDLVELTTKPLTIIYPGARNVAPSLVAEDGSIGIRVTDDPFSRDLCARLRAPLVSTSANISGEPTPLNFDAIADEIKAGVDYVVHFRQDEAAGAKPSSIIKLGVHNEVKVIRN